MGRLILDTGAPVALELGTAESTDVLPADADVAISAITTAESLVGVDLADQRHRARRETIVEGVVTRVEILAYDLDFTRHHASLLAHVRRAGRATRPPRPSDRRDRARHRQDVDHHRHDFTGLPGVSYRLLC